MESHHRDQFDQLLDGALRQYGNVEPRVGLGGRVLARLATKTRSKRAGSAWVWALSGASVAALLLVVWIGIGHRRPDTPLVSIRPNVSVKSVEKRAVVTEPIGLKRSSAKQVISRRSPARVTVAKAAEPRLRQFPSPRPISEQETMLVQYVKCYPEEAMLIVKQQNEFEEQLRQAEKEIEKSSSSDQQER
jgi:hypothetical protein